MSVVAAVRLWGTRIGAVSQDEGTGAIATFQYDPEFVASDIQVSPLVMPLKLEPRRFADLNHETYRGLPGLLADSLPDRYGNTLIDAWLAAQGRATEDFNAVERLCYIGRRGMGAFEFSPEIGPQDRHSKRIEIDALVELASDVLSERKHLEGSLAVAKRTDSLRDILMVGTSAAGARAKAVIAWNPATNETRSGQVDAGPGFEYWLLKFDGVSGNRDKELDDLQGFGAIEFAYATMARAAGITMSDCHLLKEGGRRHFMTRRFDRTEDGSKLHMQSLGALAHFDFNDPGAHSYEQAFQVIARLGLPSHAAEEQFRRMAFNIAARNQDDHVKNIAFLMNRAGAWQLAPAFDVTYAYRPDGPWTSMHQMSMNGKRDAFTVQDFTECGRVARLKGGRPQAIVREVLDAVSRWRGIADDAGVDDDQAAAIENSLRLNLPAR